MALDKRSQVSLTFGTYINLVLENKIFDGFLQYMGVVALTFETYL